MARFVRRGRTLLNRGSAGTGAPEETVLELDDNDAVEVTIAQSTDPTGAGLTTGDPTGAGLTGAGLTGAGLTGAGVPGPAGPQAQTSSPAARDSRIQQLRLVALILVIVLSVLVAVLAIRRTQAPTIDELRARAGWSDLQTLRIGVSGDVPYLSDCSKAPQCSGFDIEIAKLIAAWLGVRPGNIEFDRVLPEDRERMLGRNLVTGRTVRVDLVVAAFSITTERTDNDKVVFAGPYLNTQTTVLTRRDHPPVASLSTLNDPISVDGTLITKQRVCTNGTTTSRRYLEQETTATIVIRQLNSECVALLRKREVDAAVTDAAILAGFQATYPDELRLNNIASTDDEHWGIGLGQDFTGQDEKIQARRQLVLLALNDLLTEPGQDGWQDAFDLLPPTEQTPGVDVQVVADDQQPTPWGLQPVRRWPWERSGSGSGQ